MSGLMNGSAGERPPARNPCPVNGSAGHVHAHVPLCARRAIDYALPPEGARGGEVREHEA